MNPIVVALFVACAIGSSLAADDCQAKFEEFHKCTKGAHEAAGKQFKEKFESLKGALGKCYTDNGCTAPTPPQKGGKGGSSGSSGEKSGPNVQCFKDLRTAEKTKFEECLKGKGVALPAKGGEKDGGKWGGDHKGFGGHKEENKALDGCVAKEKVRDCKKALFASAKPSDAEKEKAFTDGCNAKAACKKALGDACQKQLEAFKAAAESCKDTLKSQKDSIRAGVASCAGVTPRPAGGRGGKGGPSGEKKKGEKKDYCALGYKVWAADHQGKGPK